MLDYQLRQPYESTKQITKDSELNFIPPNLTGRRR